VRTPAARAGIVAAAVAAVVALFFAFTSDDGGADSATTQPQGTQATTDGQSPTLSTMTEPQSAPGTTETGSAAPPSPTIERIVVRGGRLAGGVKRLEYKRGDRVLFSVHTDVADEVHVHGFDITKAVPANRRVSFRFPADIEGVFEVELHDAEMKIAELRIRP
jgi:hypothetical protein